MNLYIPCIYEFCGAHLRFHKDDSNRLLYLKYFLMKHYKKSAQSDIYFVLAVLKAEHWPGQRR